MVTMLDAVTVTVEKATSATGMVCVVLMPALVVAVLSLLFMPFSWGLCGVRCFLGQKRHIADGTSWDDVQIDTVPPRCLECIRSKVHFMGSACTLWIGSMFFYLSLGLPTRK